MKPPLISVIMSVRNSDKTIKASINSILNQSFTNFEFIIINDNSSDNTNLILKEYKKDDRIIVLNNKEKLGLTKSLNIAAKKAKGNFLARQDDDDISHKNRFKKQIEYIKKSNTCLNWNLVQYYY